jgi:hypothetical protein
MNLKLKNSRKKYKLYAFPVYTAIFLLVISCTPQGRLTYIQDKQDIGDELNCNKLITY